MPYLFWVWNKNGGSKYFGFQDTVDLCSATSFKRSPRELSIDVAEHRYILITVIHTNPLLVSHRKYVENSLKLFLYCDKVRLNNRCLSLHSVLASIRKKEVESATSNLYRVQEYLD